MDKKKATKALVSVASTAVNVGLEFLPGFNALYQKGKAETLRVRERAFFSGLCEGRTNITEEVLKDNDLVYALVMTMDAAHRSSSEQKAERFGRLFGSYCAGTIESLDKLEQCQAALAGLTESEWIVALEIKEAVGRTPYGADRAKYWTGDARLKATGQRSSVAQKCKVTPEYLDALCLRVQAQGLIRLAYSGGESKNLMFYPTPLPLLDDLISYVQK